MASSRERRTVFIRFVIPELDRRSHHRQGLFQAAHWLRDIGALTPVDEMLLGIILEWFDANLKVPPRPSLSTRGGRQRKALSWYRDTAHEHIDKMRDMQAVLERYDTPVEMITTRRLGYVLYEDEFQVVAYPFGDTAT